MRTRIVCLAFAIVLLCPCASAQWVQISQGLPDSILVRCLAVGGTNLFAGAYGAGVFLSTNNGTSWTVVNEGLTDSNINAVAVSGTNLFAGTWQNGVFRSTDNGTSWTLDTVLGICNVVSIAVSGPSVFVETMHNIFLSTDNGNSWSAIGDGLPLEGWEGGGQSLSALAVDGTNVFAGVIDIEWKFGWTSGNGIILSTDYGTSWTWVNNSLTDLLVLALAVSGTDLFAGTGSGAFISTNSGTSWTQVSLPNCCVKSFATSGPSLFVGTGDGVFLSTNDGTSWTQVNTGLLDTNVTALAISGTNLIAGTFDSGVWRRPLSEMTTSAPGQTATNPSRFTLDQNYPNPFNPSTTIKYELPMTSMVRVSVYDILGREVSVLVNERKDAGSHEVKFNVVALASGVYFYRLQAGSYSETKKLLVTK